MKKSLLAIAVLGAFTSAAQAQSTVTLSGGVALGLMRQGTATSNDWTLGNPASSRSGFTLSGTEDLGGGMSAFFLLNHRFRANDGQLNAGSGAANVSQFWRQTWVGLKGGFGDVRLGRMLMPLQDYNGNFEAWGGGDGIGGTVHTGGISATVRANNQIHYRSPSLGGLTVNAAIAAGEGQIATGGSSTAAATAFPGSERPVGFGVRYDAGPLSLAVAYDKNPLDRKTLGFYGKYNLGVATLMTQYEKGDLTATREVDRWSLSATIPMGAATIKAGYGSWSDENIKRLGIGMDYALSKRTYTYANMVKVSGSGATVADKKSKFEVGVAHRF